jgi:hypothetical protein
MQMQHSADAGIAKLLQRHLLGAKAVGKHAAEFFHPLGGIGIAAAQDLRGENWQCARFMLQRSHEMLPPVRAP